MKKNIPLLLSLVMAALIAVGCSSGGGIETFNTPQSFAESSVQKNAFALGSDFPPDIQIPDVNGMDSTAFVTSFFPAAVIPIDLNSSPLTRSTTFAGFDASGVSQVGSPNNVLIVNATQAFLSGTVGFAGDSGLAYFNPTTGELLETVHLSETIQLNDDLPYSQPADCDSSLPPQDSVPAGPFVPSFVADLAVMNNRLFVSMSNACFNAGFESFYARGLVLVYDIHETSPYLTPVTSTPYIVLNGFNVTGLTALSDRLIATSSGDTSFDFATSSQIPETDSVLDEIDPESLAVTKTLSLGNVVANYQALAVTSDGATGFIGSAAFSEVYAVDLENFSVLRGANNPIRIFDEEVDYISDQEIALGDQVLFVSSFNQSAVKAIDLSTDDFNVLPNVLNFSFEENVGITGAGPMAIRPGQPGVDYNGPDLFILTSNPGTVSTAKTY